MEEREELEEGEEEGAPTTTVSSVVKLVERYVRVQSTVNFF